MSDNISNYLQWCANNKYGLSYRTLEDIKHPTIGSKEHIG